MRYYSKKGPFVSVISLQGIISETIKFVLEELSLGWLPKEKPGGVVKKTCKKLP